MAPSNITIRLVEQPSDELIKAALKIFEDTMKDDSSVLSATMGRAELTPLILEAVIKPIALEVGMYAATDESGKLVGFCVWSPPGHSIFHTEHRTITGLHDFVGVASFSDEKPALYKKKAQEQPQFIEECFGKPSASEESYWGCFAAVIPEYQSQGIIHDIFHLVWQKAKAQDVTVGMLVSNKNHAEWAKKTGFQLKGHKEFTAPWGNWEWWCLAKDPRAN